MVIMKYIKNYDYVKKLILTLPYSSMPLKVNGFWRSSKLSKRKLKELFRASKYLFLKDIDFMG
jgi:hypothetical protein